MASNTEFTYIPINIPNEYGPDHMMLINKENIVSMDFSIDLLLGPFNENNPEPYMINVSIKALDQLPICKQMTKAEFLEFATYFPCCGASNSPFHKVLEYFESVKKKS